MDVTDVRNDLAPVSIGVDTARTIRIIHGPKFRRSRFLSRAPAIGATLALALFVPALGAQRPAIRDSTRSHTRFRDPEQITGDPTGLSIDFTGLLSPRYPDDARVAERTSAPVVAFVVDTAGRVEPGTASFLNDPTREFRTAVCAALPELRFHPLVIDGRKQRVLLAQLYAFNTLKTPNPAAIAQADSLAKASQERFGTRPVSDVIPELERRPHCN